MSSPTAIWKETDESEGSVNIANVIYTRGDLLDEFNERKKRNVSSSTGIMGRDR